MGLRGAELHPKTSPNGWMAGQSDGKVAGKAARELSFQLDTAEAAPTHNLATRRPPRRGGAGPVSRGAGRLTCR